MKGIFIITIMFMHTVAFGQTVDDRVIYTKSVKPTQSEAANDFYNKGVDFSLKDDYTNAIRYYKLAIKEDSTFIDAYDNIGLAYRKTNNLTEAIKYYNISYKLNDSNVSVIMNLAVIYGLKKNYPKALEFYKKIIAIEPTNPEGYYGACQTLVNNKKDIEAISYCKKAEEIYKATNEPYVGDVDYILCIAYYNTKNYSNAKKYLQIAKKYGVSVDPGVERAINNK